MAAIALINIFGHSHSQNRQILCLFSLFLKLHLLGQQWVISLYNFQVGSFIRWRLCNLILCAPPKAQPLSSPLTDPLYLLHSTHPPTFSPLPSGNHNFVVCVYEFGFFCLFCLFSCCFICYIQHMSKLIQFLSFCVWLFSLGISFEHQEILPPQSLPVDCFSLSTDQN